MAPDPQSGTTPVRLRHRSLVADVAEAEDAAGRELAEATPQLGVRVSPSAPFTPSGDRRVVPRPVCKTGARLEQWRSDSSVTAYSSVAQLARANGSYPCGFLKGSTPGGGTGQHRPLVTRYQHAWPSSRRPSVGIRHGRPLPAWRNQADAPRSDRVALEARCRFESCRRHPAHQRKTTPGGRSPAPRSGWPSDTPG